MAKRVLIYLEDARASKTLADFFQKRGDKTWLATSLAQAGGVLKREKPEIVFVDLHLPLADLSKILKFIQRELPSAGVIITNRHPDFRREMLARELGAKVFLRYPLTPHWIETALKRLEQSDRRLVAYVNSSEALPPVRWPVRYKITLPYALLALLFAFVSAFLVSRYVLESVMDRFTAQLIDAGKLSADWMVQEEGRLLGTLRLIANTSGMAEAVLANDASQLRLIALPIMVNAQEEAVEILDARGISLLSIRHHQGESWEQVMISQGDTSLSAYPFVQQALSGREDELGDKYAGVIPTDLGETFYVAGPIYDSQNRSVGAVLVGKSLETLAQEIRQDTLSQITFYSLEGVPLASTIFISEGLQPLAFDLSQQVLLNQDHASSIRELTFAGNKYSEILGAWEARGGVDLGIVGASLAQNFLARPSLVTRVQIFLIILIGLVAVITLGVFLANQITNPLARVVQASVELARGNLDVKVPSDGNDEISVLAYAFNYMVSGLQEGIIYRDLLGRTVSPQVREALRRSFASGDLRLEGQSAEATVLISDIRGFTALAEKEEPTTILNWLNEYFGELVPVITSHGGVVDKFEGDSMLAFFGILPTPLPVQESAYQACLAAVELLETVEKINLRRMNRGEPPLITGIGVNTGRLIAGGLGTADRLNYTVIGDSVNTTQRIQGVSRTFGESGIVVTENTLVALAGHRSEFNLEPLGEHAFKGKMEQLWLYRLYPSKTVQKVEEPTPT